MVNNKKTKREKDIKSKLLAAVAMLLVSSIMMVSTTYAWFTLSTAPEVTGITTTIGSNGNLEIALSPSSGLGSDVGDANLTTGNVWTVKNLTWGNLVDMSDVSYGLAGLTLAPAQLALTGTAGAYTLGDNALATPSYGSDGRISALNVNAYIAGKAVGATGYSTTDADYGVRAVGTASGMSAQEAKFKNSVNAISTYANAAIAAANNSLAVNGNALASMLVSHAAAMNSTDNNNYATYVPALVALTTDLSAAVTSIDEALRAALAAAAASSLANDQAKFDLAIAAIEGKTDGVYNNTVAELIAQAADLGFSVPADVNTIMGKRNTLASTISTVKAAADALMLIVDTTGGPENTPDGKVDMTEPDQDGNIKPVATVTWNDAGSVLTNLMNTSGDIRVSGYTLDELKELVNPSDPDMDFALSLATDCQIQLGAGSGVYYDLALIAGNVNAKVPEAPISVMGFNVNLKNIIIKTTVANGTSALPVMKGVINANPPATTGGNTSVLDSYYGYVIDLMVRTNAANSNLKLQTAPAQRVYSDSSNEATMGKGTTIVFTTEKQSDVATLNNLVKSIRVLFFDPSHGDAVFGLAKVTSVQITEEDTGRTEQQTVTGEDGQTTTVEVPVIKYTITGTLELCQMVGDATNTLFTAGEKLESQNLCPLSQNIPQAISAMVYLDGNDVTSSDVLANGNIVGALNLQFASDATLKPMENSELRNGTGNQG